MENFLADLAAGKVNKYRELTPLHFEYEAPKINRSEILRYAGYPASVLRKKSLEAQAEKCAQCGKKCSMSVDNCELIGENGADFSDDTLDELIDSTIPMLQKELTYRVSCCCLNLEFDEAGKPLLPFEHSSKNLQENLKNCSGVVIFVATIGAGIDRLIRRYERTQPARGLVLQGAGAERVEALCDEFNEQVRVLAEKQGLKLHPRYSPGYGDLSINVQSDVLRITNAEKTLGVTLSDSYLMAPSKTVTAIIGIEKV